MEGIITVHDEKGVIMFHDMIDKHIDRMKEDVKRSNASESSKRRQMKNLEAMRYNTKRTYDETDPVILGFIIEKLVEVVMNWNRNRKLKVIVKKVNRKEGKRR